MVSDPDVLQAKRKYYSKTKEKWKEYQREYRKTPQGQLQRIYRALKSKAMIEGVPFDIKPREVDQYPKVCQAIGIPLDTSSMKAYRIEKSKGFIDSNIIWVSNKGYSALILDLSKEELNHLHDFTTHLASESVGSSF